MNLELLDFKHNRFSYNLIIYKDKNMNITKFSRKKVI